jgi:purine-binding chemotaxis protein CheW
MSDATPAGSCLIFRLGGGRWFLPVGSVVEVLRRVPLTRVPGAAPAVRGLVNHRGRVLTVAHLGQILDIPLDASGSEEVVVVEAAGHRFGLAVDGVLELSSEPRTGLALIDLEQVAEAIFG